jgi:hypothetical protein
MPKDIIAPEIALLWAATELTKAWVGDAKVDSNAIVNTFDTIYTGIINTTKRQTPQTPQG